ncbi:MAG: hypothetical protein ACRCSK_06070 [Fusobacteriaceae bacterium]
MKENIFNKALQTSYLNDYRLRNEITLMEISERSGLTFSRVKKILYSKTQITCDEACQLKGVFMKKDSDKMAIFLDIGRQSMGCPFCKN